MPLMKSRICRIHTTESDSSESHNADATVRPDKILTFRSGLACVCVRERDEWPRCVAEGSQKIIASLSSGGGALRSAL